MSSDARPAKKESAAASARRRSAEARRRRILEQSRERMSTVEGLPPPVKDEDSHVETAVNVEAEPLEGKLPDVKDEENADKAEASDDTDDKEVEKESDGIHDDTKTADTRTPEGEDGTWKPPSSSRLQQMRRRRFKKQEPKKDEGDDEQHNQNDANVHESGIAGDEDKTNATGLQPQDRPVESHKPKQYMGVAKMRRQRILQQRAKDAEEDSTDNDGQGGDVPPLTMEELRAKKMTLFQRHMPIVLELVVVTLLILCGADVGYQSFVQNTGVGVSDILEFQQASSFMATYVSDDRKLLYKNGGVFNLGIHAGSNLLFWSSSIGLGEETSVFGQGRKLFQDKLSDEDKKKAIIEPHVQYNDDGSVTPLDEFVNDSKGKGHAEVDDDEEDISYDNPYEKQKSEGDPLAALDAIFSFFFGIFGRFFGLFTGVFNFTCPPVFFVAALALRQAGRMAGCKTPAEAEKKRQEELDVSLSAVGGGDDKKAGSLPSIDILGMVKKFFSTNFKTLTVLFSTLGDAKSDVYIVLCGWFLGLVIPKLYLWHVVMSEDDGGEKDGTCSFWTGSTNSLSSEL